MSRDRLHTLLLVLILLGVLYCAMELARFGQVLDALDQLGRRLGTA